LTKYIKLKQAADIDTDLNDEVIENLKECKILLASYKKFELIVVAYLERKQIINIT